MLDLVGMSIGMIRRGRAADAHEVVEKALALGMAALETEDHRQQMAAHFPAQQETTIH